MKILSLIQHLIQKVLAPIRCIVCSNPGSYLCRQHERYLLLYPDCCWHCMQPTIDARHCGQTQTCLSGILVGFIYTRLIKTMIHKAKYAGAYHLFSYFAQKLGLMIEANGSLWQAVKLQRCAITFVPMHHRKEHYIRGYNQAECLARYLSDLLDVPLVGLLHKTRATGAQIKKNRKQRHNQDTDLYIPTGKALPPDTTIIIVDDILTTGVTLSNCAAALSSAYPSCQIRGICIARNI